MSENDRTTGLVGYSGMKVPVRAATTAAITLSAAQTIDGVAVVDGDRVLVKNQASSQDNGIYVVDTGSWDRSADCDGPYDLRKGSVLYVTDGSTNQGFWYCTSANPVDIDSDNLTFERASSTLAAVSSYWQTIIQTAENVAVIHAARLATNVSAASPVDPVGYWTPLYIVALGNLDNVATFRNQTANVTGQNAFRMQDYLGNERGALGYGNIRADDAFNRSVFVEIGNIADASGVTPANAKGTSFKVVNTHLNRSDFTDGAYQALLLGEYGELVYKGGPSALPSLNSISFYVDRQGFFGVGPSFPVPNPYLADATANLQSRFQVNGNVFIDPDNLGAAGDANSASLVVERDDGAAAFVVGRFVRQAVGGIAIGYSTQGVIGVDGGNISFRTATTGADITTGTERMSVRSTGSVTAGTPSLATTATDGFLYVPACAGAPTGVPTGITGMVPVIVDSTNNKLYFRSGGAWRDAGP